MLLRLLFLLLPLSAFAEGPTRDDILDIARKGWTYELRTTMRRPGSAALVGELNARAMAKAHVCILGETPNDHSGQVIDNFTYLMKTAFGTKPQFTHATLIQDCHDKATVFLRLYSTQDPTGALNADLSHLNTRFGLRLGRSKQFPSSPAQAQTLFGTKGRATHLLVMQAGPDTQPDWHDRYYKSLLIEELYQSFTFGMDILHYDRKAPIFSKLEEIPLYARHLPWRSDDFIRIMQQTGPSGLCGTDLVMLAALGKTKLTRTNTLEFNDFINVEMNQLLATARVWQKDTQIAGLLDLSCQTLPD